VRKPNTCWQMTNTVPATSSPQFLDKLKVERERGITVKAQTVSIIHTHTDGNRYLINLIDTPGHVDFSYEVSRSLGACEGGLLLVDCTREYGLCSPHILLRAKTLKVELGLTTLRDSRGHSGTNAIRLSRRTGSRPHLAGSDQQGRPGTCITGSHVRAD
jgi:hypothetical protein